MQDGAPPHFVLPVREWLENIFPDLWIGRGGGKKELPPRRPDLVLYLFFLWVWADQVVSRSNPRTLVSRSNPRILDELERKIRDTLPVFLVTF